MRHKSLRISGFPTTTIFLGILLVGLYGCPPRNVRRGATVTSPPKRPVTSVPEKQTGLAWEEWKSDAYGFQMLIPKAMRMQAWGFGNWGGFHGVLDPIDLYGLAWLNHFPTPQVMKNFAINQIGIPAKKWKLIHQGKNEHGFKWYKTFRATEKGKFSYILLGHGPKGAYIIHLTTTPANQFLFNAHYIKWYTSIRLF